jgi:hypothetical protein
MELAPAPRHATLLRQAGLDMTPSTEDIVVDLRRLVEAIDRRAPQRARLDEGRIAHEAADLRRRAVALMHNLTDASIARPLSQN